MFHVKRGAKTIFMQVHKKEVFEVVQWLGTADSWREIISLEPEWLPGEMGSDTFYLGTNDGRAKVNKGDWVIKQPDGQEFSVVSEEKFIERYQPVEHIIVDLKSIPDGWSAEDVVRQWHQTGLILTNSQEAATIEEINRLIQQSGVDHNLISDGYHTFGELYSHRIELFIALCRELYKNPEYNTYKQVWKCPVLEGWFIMGINTEPGKQISYHLPESKWEQTSFAKVIEKYEYDFHTPADVLERLKTL